MSDDWDLTDLARIPDTKVPIILEEMHGTKAKLDAVRECVFLKEDGTIDGKIGLINSKNKFVPAAPIPDEAKDYLLRCAQCVGRMFVRYVRDDKTTVTYVGSGFFVAESIVLTARHVVKESHEDGALKRDRVWIYMGATATDGEEVDTHSTEDPDLVELSVLPRYPDETQTVFNVREGEAWKTPNDFAFLQVKDSTSFKAQTFAQPTVFEPADAAVIGYPGFITKGKFKEDYSDGRDEAHVGTLFDDLATASGGFERKICSLGQAHEHTELGIIEHRCPTLRGVSGGMVVPASSEDVRFMALHIGGSRTVEQNFGIATQHDQFKMAFTHALTFSS